MSLEVLGDEVQPPRVDVDGPHENERIVALHRAGDEAGSLGAVA
jgi:hypothetical protein